MTAQPTGHAMWSPDPIRQGHARHTVGGAPLLPLTKPFQIRLPVADVTP